VTSQAPARSQAATSSGRRAGTDTAVREEGSSSSPSPSICRVEEDQYSSRRQRRSGQRRQADAGPRQLHARRAISFCRRAPTCSSSTYRQAARLGRRSLIRSLENDDANRALMGRTCSAGGTAPPRAAPFWSAPAWSTYGARFGRRHRGRRSGTIDYVDSSASSCAWRASRKNDQGDGRRHLPMSKFKRSNQNTCITQEPTRAVARRCIKARCSATVRAPELGELAARAERARRVMPWRAPHFGDAILVSRRMVKDDYYTSIHIEDSRSSRATRSSAQEMHAATSRSVSETS